MTASITAKQRVVKIPDQPEDGIDGYGGKDFEKRTVLRREGKAMRKHNNRSRNDQSITMEISCVVMMHETDKE